MSFGDSVFARILRPAAVAGLVAGLALVAVEANAAASGANLRLAQGVVRQAAYEAPQKTQYVVSIGGPVAKDIGANESDTGLILKVGERVDALAEADRGLWVLIGRNGEGIGYVRRAMLCPTDLCPPGSPTASPPSGS